MVARVSHIHKLYVFLIPPYYNTFCNHHHLLPVKKRLYAQTSSQQTPYLRAILTKCKLPYYTITQNEFYPQGIAQMGEREKRGKGGAGDGRKIGVF
jgi:hypothetical protein